MALKSEAFEQKIEESVLSENKESPSKQSSSIESEEAELAKSILIEDSESFSASSKSWVEGSEDSLPFCPQDTQVFVKTQDEKLLTLNLDTSIYTVESIK